jgi:signal transduction histidine kinase
MSITNPNPNATLVGLAGVSRFERVLELVDTIQRLSLARALDEIQRIVRTAARRLTGADGATFVLREGSKCYYADEDAISPLWKGQRFPLETCISGWAMLNRKAAVIEDIYADDRIPHDAYRPTFVKSLAMVPIRTLDPIGAIGNYWASRHLPTEEELELLRALADSTAVALENVSVYQELEERVADRTGELLETNESVRTMYEEANANLDALRVRNDHYLEVMNTLAHEVRNSLAVARACLMVATRDEVNGSRDLLRDAETSVGQALDVVNRQLEAARLEAGVVDVRPVDVDLNEELRKLRPLFRAFATNVSVELLLDEPAELIALRTDPMVLGHILRNLVTNALKFTDSGHVRVSAERSPDGEVAISVADTGIGMSPEDAERVLEDWQQVADAQERRHEGSGVGLPLVRRLVEALGGRLELETTPGRGTTFTVVLTPAAEAATG